MVNNQDLSISPGMCANTQMQLAHADNVTTIPVEALVIKGDQQTVYCLDSDNRIRIRTVRVVNTPTEVDHYQIRRVIDIYVSTKTEALQGVGRDIGKLLADARTDKNAVLNLRGAVVSMNHSSAEFGIGLVTAVLMVYLILMTQFTSFVEPFIILMAIPPRLAGVVLILLLTGSTLNIMSLMGVTMMTGIVVPNSILIVEFAGTLHSQGLSLLEAVVQSCKIRLRPMDDEGDNPSSIRIYETLLCG